MPTSIEFPEVNVVLAKDQPQYNPLHAHRVPDDPLGRVITAWHFTDAEMQAAWEAAAIFKEGGCVFWHQVLTFGQPYPPMALMAEKPAVLPPVVADPSAVLSPLYTAQEYELAIQEGESRSFMGGGRDAALKDLRATLARNRNPKP